MTGLPGYEGRFGVRWWRERELPPAEEALSDDPAALGALAARRIAHDGFVYAELSVWNFELNDWVRLETFGARTPRAEV
jgi:hypothetical protein